VHLIPVNLLPATHSLTLSSAVKRMQLVFVALALLATCSQQVAGVMTFASSYANTAPGSSFNLQSLDTSHTYNLNLGFVPFVSPISSASTGLFNGATGQLYANGGDRDHCPFWYNNEMYVFATYEAFTNPTAGAKFVIYKFNKLTQTLQLHRLIQTGFTVTTASAGAQKATQAWRPRPFIYAGRVQVLIPTNYAFGGANPINLLRVEMNSDLTGIAYYSTITDTVFASAAVQNSGILSGIFMDAAPMFNTAGVYKGFIAKDANSPGSSGSGNRMVYAGDDGKFVSQIASLNTLSTTGASGSTGGTFLAIEAMSVIQNTDYTWTMYFKQLGTQNQYTIALSDITYEVVPGAVPVIFTTGSNMGCIAQLPDSPF
jgi:hypothetical protein